MKRGDNVLYWPSQRDTDLRIDEDKSPIPAKILTMHGPHRADLQVIPYEGEKTLKFDVPIAKGHPNYSDFSGKFTTIN